MGWHAMQQELAVPLSDLNLLALSIKGEGICDDRGVVLIDHVVLVFTGGKYNVAANHDSRPDECRCENVLVVNYRRVGPMECHICHGLPFAVGPLKVNAFGSTSITTLEVACHFTFGLRVLFRDELWWCSLWFLDFRWSGFPSSEIGGRGL